MINLTGGTVWPLWRKIVFRFAFIYLVLYMAPWSLVASAIPGIGTVTEYYDMGWDWLVHLFNSHIYTVAEELVPLNGSGDTSFAWASLAFLLSLSALGCIIWSVLDRNRSNYQKIDYWLRVCVRYYISFYCLLYGIIKLFTLQMYFPNLSQLATPLGDFLPMRFSWLFIGYSTPYQIFSGVMETIAGLLLINRKTVTLGLIMATGVFIHVFVLNLAYDIPVKLFSGHLLLLCLYLLSYETNRLLDFFIFNRVSEPDRFFNVEFTNRWGRYFRIVAKCVFIVTAFAIPLYDSYEQYKSAYAPYVAKPVKQGVYNVDLFVLNKKDTIPPLTTDTLRWKQVIFEGSFGSVDAAEELFFKRYNRRYFNLNSDTVKHLLKFKPFRDTTTVLTMKYDLPDEKTVQLWSLYKGDSLYMKLTRTERHFQLTERQFHWLSEGNR